MILSDATHLSITPQRILSLVPSQTELLYYLGAGDNVIGITKFCIHPTQWQRTKTIVGGTKNILINKIKESIPDLIIANKEENVKEQIEELAKDFPVWVTDVYDLESALQMINDIGQLTKHRTKANLLTNHIIQSFTQFSKPQHRLNTAYLIWQNPYMTVGGDTFIHDMLEHCGLQNIFADETRYPVITIERLKMQDCQLLLLSSEPYPFKQKHIDELQTQLPDTLILLVDGEMFSWYGSRLLFAVDYFKKLVAKIYETG